MYTRMYTESEFSHDPYTHADARTTTFFLQVSESKVKAHKGNQGSVDPSKLQVSVIRSICLVFLHVVVEWTK